MAVLVSAGVLVGPFNGQDGTLVVIQVPHIVTTSVVVLRVKQPNKQTSKQLINKQTINKAIN